MGRQISFRLRKIDSDLEEAIKKMTSEELTEACRTGLRVMLGITTTKTTQVIEKPITIPNRVQGVKASIGNPAPQPYKPKP